MLVTLNGSPSGNPVVDLKEGPVPPLTTRRLSMVEMAWCHGCKSLLGTLMCFARWKTGQPWKAIVTFDYVTDCTCNMFVYIPCLFDQSRYWPPHHCSVLLTSVSKQASWWVVCKPPVPQRAFTSLNPPFAFSVTALDGASSVRATTTSLSIFFSGGIAATKKQETSKTMCFI